MRQLLDRFDFRIGPTTVAFVKSTNDDRLWCAHTMRFSSSLRPTKDENRMVCAGLKALVLWREKDALQELRFPYLLFGDMIRVTTYLPTELKVTLPYFYPLGVL